LAHAQVVYEDINNTGIYDFLDELANNKVIELNSVVKPYSRIYITKKLMEAEKQLIINNEELKIRVNKRQVKELHFYLQDFLPEYRILINEFRILNEKKEDISRIRDTAIQFVPRPSSLVPRNYDHKLGFLFKKNQDFAVSLNPLAFQYQDRLFTLSVRPILGFSYMANENSNMYHRYWGASGFMYIRKYFGGYASLRDNYATQLLVQPQYLTLGTGGIYKVNEGGRTGGDWSEMRGGISVSWKWGSFGLMKDFFTWGNNYHGSNIFSDHAPSFPYIQLHINPVKWFDFYYIHGWLASKVVDSSRSYWIGDEYRIVYHSKYIAANMFTFTPVKRLNISFGNSIIYSGDINLGFLIPFMFFKSVDHSSYFNNNAGSNAQMFIDISSRQIKHLHLYVTLFIDELKTSRIFKKDENNFTSWKFGFRLSDFPVRNLSITSEYTRTQPMAYKHYLQITDFTSNLYNMGNWMRDNSQEIYIALAWKPIRGLLFNGSLTLAEHGDDVAYDSNKGYDVTKIPFMKNKTWEDQEITFLARYELVSNIYLWLQYMNTNRRGDVRYGPEILHGKTNTVMAGMNVGF
jgi:hypothetical protein